MLNIIFSSKCTESKFEIPNKNIAGHNLRRHDTPTTSAKTKIRLHTTLITPVLMYGCETWKVNKRDEKKIDVFQNNTKSQYEMAG